MECHCIILHATTPEMRERVVKALEQARHMGDSTAITLCLAQLGPCPSQTKADKLLETK